MQCGGSLIRRAEVRGQRSEGNALNTTHGSGWIVQVLPTKKCGAFCFSEYHPRQWVDRSGPAYNERRPLLFLPLGVRGKDKRRKWNAICRLDLNDPPTAVGGIWGNKTASISCRLDLNNPPTAVGGIQKRAVRSSSFVGWT